MNRKWKKADYTIGRLYIDGELICNTLEDTDRGLCQGMSLEYLKRMKIQGETAIPSGRYRITLKQFSPAFGRRKYYQDFCQGFLPRLLDVPAFDGILMHRGLNQNHTEGCILLGYNTVKGQLTDSQKAFELVYHLIEGAIAKGEEVWLHID